MSHRHDHDESAANQDTHPNRKAHAACGFHCTHVDDLSVTLGGNRVLENINLHIHCGQLTAVIGPNGAGKSTLLKAIMGQVPYSGDLTFQDIQAQRVSRPTTGYVPQWVNHGDAAVISVRDLFYTSLSRRPTWWRRAPRLEKRMLDSLAKVRSDHLVDRPLSGLSRGELQRVLLSLALEPLPNLLLLDEPETGIDLEGLKLFYDVVSDVRNNHDLSIILVSHNVSLVMEHADRIVLLNKRLVASGQPSEVVTEANVAATFGASFAALNTRVPHGPAA